MYPKKPSFEEGSEIPIYKWDFTNYLISFLKLINMV